METSIIRPAGPADAIAVLKVIDTAYSSWTKTLPDLPDVSGGVEEDIADGRVWVAISGAVVVGCLIGGDFDGVWHVANVAVSPDHSGKGVGSALMRFAVDQAQREGLGQLVLATHQEMTGNVALYEHLGWRVTGQDGNKIMMQRNTT